MVNIYFLKNVNISKTAEPIMMPNELKNCIDIFYIHFKFHQNWTNGSKVIALHTYKHTKTVFLPHVDFIHAYLILINVMDF